MDDKKNSTELSPLDNATSTATRVKPATAPRPTTPAKRESAYFPIVHGKAIDTIPLYGHAEKIDPITGKAIITADDAKAVVNWAQDKALQGGINVHKLLCVGIGEFTKNNHIGGSKTAKIIYEVNIPFKDYATELGYDITPRYFSGDSKEKRDIEKSRAKNALKSAKKRIRKHLQFLKEVDLTWDEKVKGKEEDFIGVSVIGSRAIKNGYITMVFDPVFAEYLIRLPIGWYPYSLLRIDAKNPNAYKIGSKLSTHYFIDNNIRKGTNHLLKVKRLLEQTDLPDISTIRKQRKSWEERIKEPLENSLDYLYSNGTISEWYYCKSKGIRLTDEEATRFFSFEAWADTLVYFELVDAPDQTKRLEIKAKQIEEAKKKKDQRELAKARAKGKREAELEAEERKEAEGAEDYN